MRKYYYFYEALKEIRKEKELTQEQFSYNSNISAKYYGRIERGEVNTSISKIFQICEGNNISLSDFDKKINEKYILSR